MRSASMRSKVTSEPAQAFVRLVFIAVYALAFIFVGFGHWSPTTSVVLYGVVGVLWVLLVCIYVAGLARSTARRRYAIDHPAIPLLLVAPVFLMLSWNAVWFVLLVTAYVLELRQHSAGRAFTFSFCLIVFVGVLAAVAMAEIENDVLGPGGYGPVDSFLWAFGSLLRINTGETLTPVTQHGKFLSVVLQVCAILAASMFTARLVAWIVGSQEQQAEKEDAFDDALIRSEIAELRVAIERLSDRIEGKGTDAT